MTFDRKAIMIAAHKQARIEMKASRISYAQAFKISLGYQWYRAKLAAIDAARPALTAKDLVTSLDRAASNAINQRLTPASKKQTWYLASLIARHGWRLADIGLQASGAILTSRDASRWIDTINETYAAKQAA